MARTLRFEDSTEGLTIRTIDSPTAHRNVALFWLRKRGDSAVVKAFLDAQHRVPLPPGVLATVTTSP